MTAGQSGVMFSSESDGCRPRKDDVLGERRDDHGPCQ